MSGYENKDIIDKALNEKQRTWKIMMLRALGMQSEEQPWAKFPPNAKTDELAVYLVKDPLVALSVLASKPAPEELAPVIEKAKNFKVGQTEIGLEKPIVALHGDDPNYIESLCGTLLGPHIDKARSEKATFLRGNTLTVKLLKEYSLSGGGKEYVENTTREALSILKPKDEKPSDVADPEKVWNAVESVIKAFYEQTAPRAVATSCSMIADGAREAGMNGKEVMALVGGHVFLRLISPSLTGPGAGADLMMTSKILQLLANGGTPTKDYKDLGTYIEPLRQRFGEIANQGRQIRELKPIDYNLMLLGDEENETQTQGETEELPTYDPLGEEGTAEGGEDWLGLFSGPQGMKEDIDVLAEGGEEENEDALDQSDPLGSEGGTRKKKTNFFTDLSEGRGMLDFGNKPSDLGDDDDPLGGSKKPSGENIFSDNAPHEEIVGTSFLSDLINPSKSPPVSDKKKYIDLMDEEDFTGGGGRARGDTRANPSNRNTSNQNPSTNK